jgi:hypothetical protein
MTPGTPGIPGSSNTFALTAGGGLDLRLSVHFAIHVIQADYHYTRFENGARIDSDSHSYVLRSDERKGYRKTDMPALLRAIGASVILDLDEKSWGGGNGVVLRQRP